MWNTNQPNGGYFYNGMPIGNSFAQRYAQNQAYGACPQPSMQFSNTFPNYMPYYYYNQERQQSGNEMRNFQRNFLLSQGQGQWQSQGRGQLQGPRQVWYQIQQPQQSYNNYYKTLQQQSMANAYNLAQMKHANVARSTAQSVQPTASKSPEMPSAAQSMNVTAEHSSYPLSPRTTVSRHQGHSYIPHVSSGSSGSGKLNRIDSVSSFKNTNGSRIRNSLHDLVEYRRVAARTLCEKDRNEEEELRKQFQMRQDVINERIKERNKSDIRNMISKLQQNIFELSKQSQESITTEIPESDSDFQVMVFDEAPANKKRSKNRKTVKTNLVIEEPLSTRDNSFFHKLGLFNCGNKKHSFFSMLHRNSKSHSFKPSCSTTKKSRIVKRFFSD